MWAENGISGGGHGRRMVFPYMGEWVTELLASGCSKSLKYGGGGGT